MDFTRDVMEALGAAFPEDEIDFLPRAQSGGKALGLPYIDARDVMRRLDAVVGPENWNFDFELVSPDGKMVKGKLTVCGVTKCDAGEANQEDEVLKSAVSDALKRCAVHFGVGRYLYYLPKVWAPYDNQRRQFTERPKLSPAAVERALSVCGVSSRSNGRAAVPVAPAASPAPVAPAASAAPVTPAAAPERSAAPAPRPVQREAAPVEQQSARPGTPGEQHESGRRSIWSAGATGEEQPAAEAPAPRAPREGATAPHPESSGDRAATRTVPAAEPAAASMECSGEGCGKPLTKGQHNMSVRAFGRPLCPACQKEAARIGA